jgi:magnesium transporter
MEGKRSKKPGLPPGTLAAPAGAHVPTSFHVIHYTRDGLDEVELATAAELTPYIGKEGVTWVNVNGLGNAELIRGLGELLELHLLALEDTLSVPQRPKVDDYGTHLFAVIRMLHFAAAGPSAAIETEQVSVFLGRNFVVTVQEHPGDCLDPVRHRLRTATGQIRRQGADYLMYTILDAVIDHYFPFLEAMGEVVEELEDLVVEQPSRQILGRIHDVKRRLLEVRRAIWPLRDAINSLLRGDSALVRKPTQLYLRDCYDHTVQVLDIVETYRELAGGLMDVYLSSVSNKMNEVMKVLTVIATIFIPLTFIAGIYGMNFKNMPELGLRWAYFAVWGVMVAVAITMLLMFRRRGWLGRGKD